MKDQAEDFWIFGTPEVYRMENGLPYKTYAYSIVAGRDIIFPAEEAGQYEVFYNAWPPQITGETLDDYELPLTPDVAVLLPLYMASQLYKDDDNSIATIYRNEFEDVSYTHLAIKRKYGVDVSQEGEEAPEIRGEGADTWDELVTQNIAYFRNKDGGIGRFSWVEDTVLEDMEDYQALHIKVCAECGRPKSGNEKTCSVCGSKKWKDEVQTEEELIEDVRLFDGTIIPQFQAEEEREILAPDGTPMLDEITGAPLMQTVAVATRIPRYKPDRYPLVLRRNISKYASFMGGSDVDVICDQQEAIKKCGSKIEEKVLKGGSFVTLPEGLDVETTDKEFKIVRIKNPAQKELISVMNVQPDITCLLYTSRCV